MPRRLTTLGRTVDLRIAAGEVEQFRPEWRRPRYFEVDGGREPKSGHARWEDKPALRAPQFDAHELAAA